MSESRKCIYCDQEKELGEFSLEHIFPDSLGGSHFSNLFKTRFVCQRCNSISGLFIDGPFIKNFFFQNDRSEAALRFIDIEKPSPLPMKYMGVLENIELSEDEDCDFWMGPHGGLVYHIRRKADSRWDCMIGGNPIENKKYRGTVYIYAQNNDMYWVSVLLLSCLEHFKGARFISGNIGLPPAPEGEEPYFDNTNLSEELVLKQLSKLQGNTHQCKLAVTDGFDQRFLAKLALGLGANFFGNQFLKSQYAKNLRDALWEKDLRERQGYGVKFYKYFNEESKLKSLFAFDGAHTVLFYPIKDELFLVVFVYGRKMLMVPICPEKAIWHFYTENGFVFIAAPQIQTFIGPVDVVDYIAFKGGIKDIAALTSLQAKIFDVSKLPPIT